MQGLASGNPVQVFAALPGLQQSIQDLLSPVGVSDADVQRDRAIQARELIGDSALSGAHQVELTNQLDFLIKELTIRYIRSLPQAYEPATVAQQESLLYGKGIDFDYERDVTDLQRRGVQFSGFGEAPGEARIIDLDVFLKDLGDAIKLATEGRTGDSSAETKKRRDRRETTAPGEATPSVLAHSVLPSDVEVSVSSVAPVVFSTEIENILSNVQADIHHIVTAGVVVTNIADIPSEVIQISQTQGRLQAEGSAVVPVRIISDDTDAEKKVRTPPPIIQTVLEANLQLSINDRTVQEIFFRASELAEQNRIVNPFSRTDS